MHYIDALVSELEKEVTRLGAKIANYMLPY